MNHTEEATAAILYAHDCGDVTRFGPCFPCGWCGSYEGAFRPVEVVPREVAERLAEALEEIASSKNAMWSRFKARETLAEFRAACPKAEET